MQEHHLKSLHAIHIYQLACSLRDITLTNLTTDIPTHLENIRVQEAHDGPTSINFNDGSNLSRFGQL